MTVRQKMCSTSHGFSWLRRPDGAQRIGLKKKTYPAQPFMRPTFDATGDKAIKVFSETLKDVLEEIAKP